jgi:hypothetical protein
MPKSLDDEGERLQVMSPVLYERNRSAVTVEIVGWLLRSTVSGELNGAGVVTTL